MSHVLTVVKGLGNRPARDDNLHNRAEKKRPGAGSAPVMGYIAGKTYIVTISGTNTIPKPARR